MTAPILADRVCKARRQSTCPQCRGPVRIGQQIARMGPGCWVHATCLIRLNHDQENTSMPTIGGQLDAATAAALARHTTTTPASGQLRVSRTGARVVAIRDPDGALVLDLDTASARQLGRELLDAGRTEGQP